MADIPLSSISGGSSVIKSIQRGWFSMATNSAQDDITIAEVDLNKSVLIMSHYQTIQYAYGRASGRLLNSTTLRFNRAVVNGSTIIGWEVIEYV